MARQRVTRSSRIDPAVSTETDSEGIGLSFRKISDSFPKTTSPTKSWVQDQQIRHKSVQRRRSKKLKETEKHRAASSTSSWDTAVRLILPVVKYIADVVGGVFQLARPLVSLIILLLFLVFAFQQLTSWPRYAVSRGLKTAGRVACHVPGAAYLVPFCRTSDLDDEPQQIDFTHLMLAQSPIEELLLQNQGFTPIRHRLPQTARALKDLAISMRFSNIPTSDVMHLRLKELSKIADLVFDDLLDLTSHVDRAADVISIRNSHTAKLIENLYASDSQRSLLEKILASTPGFSLLVGRTPGENVRRYFVKHTDDVLGSVEAVLHEASSVQAKLLQMEEEFTAVQELSIEAGISNEEMREQSLGNLFNRITDQVMARIPGTDQKEERMKYQADVKLLAETGDMFKKSAAHVDNQVLQLREVRASLKGLGERAREAKWDAKLKEAWDDVPFSIHLENIQRGAEGLSEVVDMRRQRKMDDILRDDARRGRPGGDANAGRGYMIDASKAKKILNSQSRDTKSR